MPFASLFKYFQYLQNCKQELLQTPRESTDKLYKQQQQHSSEHVWEIKLCFYFSHLDASPSDQGAECQWTSKCEEEREMMEEYCLPVEIGIVW